MGNVNLDICELKDVNDNGVVGFFYGIETLFGDGNTAKTVFKLNSNTKSGLWLAITEARWQASQPDSVTIGYYSVYLYIENAYVEYQTQAFANANKKYLYDSLTSNSDGSYQLHYYRAEQQPIIVGCKKPNIEFQLNMVTDPAIAEDEIVHEIAGVIYTKRPVYITRRLVGL